MNDAAASAQDRGPSRTGRTAFWIYLLAVGLRLIPVILTRDLGIGLDDMFQYDMLGRSLAAGNGYRWYTPEDLTVMLNAIQWLRDVDISQVQPPTDPLGIETSYRVPLYPAFLAVIYRFAGLEARLFATRLVQTFAVGALAPLTFLTALQLGARKRHAKAAGLALTFWPLLLFMPLALVSEVIYLPMVTAAMLIAFKANREQRDRDYLLLGLVLGLTALTRSVIIGYVGLLVLFFFVRAQRRGAVLILLPFLLLITPWIVRNSLLHQEPTLLETNAGANLYIAYHPEGTGSFFFGPSVDLALIFDDAERNEFAMRETLGFIGDDPARALYRIVRRTGFFFGLEDRAFVYFYSNGFLGQWPAAAVVGVIAILAIPFMLLLPLAVLGWSFSTRNSNWWIATLLIAWMVAVHLLIIAEARYHFVILPTLAGFAAFATSHWTSIRDTVRQRTPSARRAIALASLLIVIAVVSWSVHLRSNADRYQMILGPLGHRTFLDY